MKPTEDLMHEHEAIKVMLRIMERISSDIRTQSKADIEEIDKITDFLKDFADKCHHGKEENSLFPALVLSGMSRESGPIAVMLYEHQLGRSFIKDIISACDAVRAGDQAKLTSLAEALDQYINLLKSHIQKENNILFPMADRLLAENEQERIYKEFERIEEEVVGHGVHEKYHELIHRLKAKYL